MSGIFGILNLDGQPVAPQNLQAMRDGMAHGGPAGLSVWQEGPVGLGHLRLLNTAEARGESLPRQDPASGIVLTAHARIDNREELADCLSHIANAKLQPYAISDTPRAIPDSDLILHAYLHWGEECVQHLIGDWAFALWDPRERKLFLARDHHGISAIYYYRQSRFIAFASSVKGLLALRDVPQRPNLLRVAQVLTAWPGDGVQTAYEEILRLPPTHVLKVTADHVQPRRYWYPENIAPLRFGSETEYVEAFLEIYGKAVRCRLRSPLSLGGVGATLERIPS